jgi:hypothetical protein
MTTQNDHRNKLKVKTALKAEPAWALPLLVNFVLVATISATGVSSAAMAKRNQPATANPFMLGEEIYVEPSNQTLGGYATITGRNESTYKLSITLNIAGGETIDDADASHFYKLRGKLPTIAGQTFSIGEKIWVTCLACGDNGHGDFAIIHAMNPTTKDMYIEWVNGFVPGMTARISGTLAAKITPGLETRSADHFKIGDRVRIMPDNIRITRQVDGTIRAYNYSRDEYTITVEDDKGRTIQWLDGLSAVTCQLNRMSFAPKRVLPLDSSPSSFSISAETLPESFETFAQSIPQPRSKLVFEIAKRLRNPELKNSTGASAFGFMAFYIVRKIVAGSNARVIQEQFKPAFDSLAKWYEQQPESYTDLRKIEPSKVSIALSVVVLRSALETYAASAQVNRQRSIELLARLTDAASETSFFKKWQKLQSLASDASPEFRQLLQDPQTAVIGEVAADINGWLSK